MPTKKASPSKSSTSKRKASSQTKAPSPKARSSSKKAQKAKAGDQEITIDRRTQGDRRGSSEESVKEQDQTERRDKVQRRRQIDPTTCERDYSTQEVEFMNAMDHYKRTSGRMFPTCSEVLEVIRGLGYVQLTPAEVALVRPEENETMDDLEAQVDEEAELDDIEHPAESVNA